VSRWRSVLLVALAAYGSVLAVSAHGLTFYGASLIVASVAGAAAYHPPSSKNFA
jgi:hypothetical protein